MKILILSQYFYPESGAGSARVYSFAKYLTKFGHNVTVLCGSPNYPSGKLYEGYKNPFRFEENISGIRVIRTKVYPTKYSSFLKRLLNYVSFNLSGFLEILRGEQFDVILASSPPITVLSLGLAAKFFKKKPLVFDIRDVWPGAAVASGNLKSKNLIKVLEGFERYSYKLASKILTINKETASLILENNDFLDHNKVEEVYNGVDLETVDLYLKNDQVINSSSSRDTLRIVYPGTIGEQFSVSTFIKAIQRVNKEDERIKFLIIAEGSKKSFFEQEIENLNLKNVEFFKMKKYEDLIPLIKRIDLGITILRENKYLDAAYPVKAFDYMAASKPILVSGGLAMKKLIEENQVGFWVPAEKPKALAGKILEISNMPKTELEEMGKRGRKLVEKEFNREKQAKKLEQILKEMARS